MLWISLILKFDAPYKSIDLNISEYLKDHVQFWGISFEEVAEASIITNE